MNKKLMSTLLFSAALLSAGVVTSCKDYDDDIDELRAGLEAVESLASELQSQIQKGAILTDVTATSNGVRLTLSNGNTFELTNGVDGEDGSVVEIGPNGNWFIDESMLQLTVQKQKKTPTSNGLPLSRLKA